MVSKKVVLDQLKRIGFKHNGWGRSEISELPHILIPGEELYECVNGIYEGGFALLVATDVRVLLIDKKPLNYLTVEDMRFDMISEMDYNHRLLGADISISAGDKALRFRSYNQQRLRKLIGHVQHCMAAIKQKESNHQEGQVQHLEQINRQLQTYLMAQQQYQIDMQKTQMARQAGASEVEAPLPTPPNPDNRLKDYMYARSLLAQYPELASQQPSSVIAMPAITQAPTAVYSQANAMTDVYNEGLREVFGKPSNAHAAPGQGSHVPLTNLHLPFEVNPLHIAYGKLPMLLRNRKFGRRALHPPTIGSMANVSTEPEAY